MARKNSKPAPFTPKSFADLDAAGLGLGYLGSSYSQPVEEEKPKERTSRTWGEAFSDTGAQLAEGVNNLAGAVPNLAAPQSGVAEFFRGNSEHWRDKQSDVLKKKIADADEKISQADQDSIIDQAIAAGRAYSSDPALISRFVTTNLPSLIPGIGAAKVAQAARLAAGASAAAAAAAGTTAAGTTNAVLNAGGARGEAFEDIKETLVKQGMSPEQAEAQALKSSRLPAAVGGVAGFASGKMGLEKALVGKGLTAGGVRAGAASLAGEMVGEQLEEVAPKLATNYQAGEFDNRPMSRDVGRTIAETAIASGPMSAVSGGLAGLNHKAGAAQAQTPANPQAAPVNDSATPANAAVTPAKVEQALQVEQAAKANPEKFPDGTPQTMPIDKVEARLAELEIGESATGLSAEQQAEKNALGLRVAEERAAEIERENVGESVDEPNAPASQNASPDGLPDSVAAEQVIPAVTQVDERQKLLADLREVAKGATGDAKKNAAEMLTLLERGGMPEHVDGFMLKEAKALVASSPVRGYAPKVEKVQAIEAKVERGESLTTQEKQEYARQQAQARPVENPLDALKKSARFTPSADVLSVIGDARQRSDAAETAEIERMLAEDEAAAESVQFGSSRETREQGTKDVDSKTRSRVLDTLVDSYTSKGQPFSGVIVPMVENQLTKLGQEPLTAQERERINKRLQSTEAFIQPNLPADIERVDSFADNDSMESLIAERGSKKKGKQSEPQEVVAPEPVGKKERPARNIRPEQAQSWPQFVAAHGIKVSTLKQESPQFRALKIGWDALKIKRAGANPMGNGSVGQRTTEIQNRDRARPASVIQMQGMAANPDYLRLGVSRSPETGAPMVFAVGDQSPSAQATGRTDTAVMSDGQRVPFQYAVMEAGDVQPSNFADGSVNPLFDAAHPGTVKSLNNGRTAGLRAAYERGTAEAYKRELMADAELHGIDPAVIQGMNSPMLVRLYSEKDNQSNMGAKSQSQALGLSASEQAATDAELVDASVVSAFESGELDSAGNRDFARAFIGKLQENGQDVAGMMDGNGSLSQAGKNRLQAAMVHKAYGDGDLVETLFSSNEGEIRAIGESLKDIAGEWAVLRQAAANGSINPQVDVTGNLMQAVSMVQKARRENSSLYDAINQIDIETGDVADPLTVGMLRLLYSGEYLTRAVGRERLTQSLREYMAAALATTAESDMFGEQIGPNDIFNALNGNPNGNNESNPESPEGQRVTTGSDTVSSSPAQAGAAEQRQEPSRTGQEADEDGGRGQGQDAQDSSELQDGESNQGDGENGGQSVSPELELSSYTAEEGRAQQEAQEKAEKQKAAEDAKAEADAKAERERKEIAARQESSAENFQLGQDPMDSLTGQESIFDAPKTEARQEAKKPAPKKPTAKQAEKARADYFTPGNVVQGYGGTFDRVVSYNPGQDGDWSVTVREVVKQGDDFVDAPSSKDRTHTTAPDAKSLKAGPVMTASEAYNRKVAKEYARIEKDQLGSQSTILSNGRPYKSEADAQKFIDDKGISGTHKVAKVDGGFAIKRLTPAEQLEATNRANGIEDYSAIQDRVIGELGYRDAVDNETATDAQWEEIEARTAEIQQQQRAKPDVRFKRGEDGKPTTPSIERDNKLKAATDTVNAIKKNWVNAPEIIIARNLMDEKIPSEVRHVDESMGGQARGFFYGGKVYLLSDYLPDTQAVTETLFHETLGHFGLRGVFGEALYPVLNQIITARGKEIKAKAEQYKIDLSTKAGKLEAAEEVLAEMAQTNPELGFVQRAVAAIRTWMRKNVPGFAAMNLSDDEIVQNFLVPAREFVVRGKSEGASSVNPGVVFSRTPAGQPSQPGQPQSKLTQLQNKVKGLVSRERMDWMIYNMQDKFIDLKRIQQQIKDLGGTVSELNDAYRGEELYHKRVAKRTENFLRDEVRPLLQGLGKAKVTIEEFEKFLHARHAGEANAKMAERNPNQSELDSKRLTAEAEVKKLRNALQHARANNSSTVAIQKSLALAIAEQDQWNSAQAFKGTEDERMSLSGMSDAEANQILTGYPADKLKDLNDLAARVDKINEGTLNTLDQYGLMDKQTLKAWRNEYEHYVPLHRDEAHPDSKAHPIGQGFSTKGDAAKQRIGSNEKVTNILSHVLMQRESALTRGEKNNVVKRLYLLASQNPDDNLWSFDLPKKKVVDPDTGLVRTVPDHAARLQDNVLSVRIGGQDKHIIFNARNEQAMRLGVAMKNLDAAELDLMTRSVGKVTRFMAAMNTQYNPVFSVMNLIRDSQGVLLQLSNTPLAGKQNDVRKLISWSNWNALMQDLRSARKNPHAPKSSWVQLFEQFQLDGGATGYRDLYADPADRAKSLNRELKKTNGERAKALKITDFVLENLSDFNESLENITRLATYKVALDSGLSRQEAASIAKNITVNFNRKGIQTSKLGAHYAFLNAAIQGNKRLYETMTGPAGKKIAMGGVALGAMSALMGQFIMGGGDGADDEWKKIPEFVKERSIIIPLSGKDYIAIPLPLGFHVLPNVGRKSVDMLMNNDPAKSRMAYVGDLALITANAFNPFGGTDNISQMLSPTWLDPFVGLMSNADWTGRQIYREDMSGLDPTPGHTRVKDSTAKVYRWISEGLNAISGGNEWKPGAMSPTPEALAYLTGSFLGGVGREANKLGAMAAAATTGEELAAKDIVFLGRIYGNTRGVTNQSPAYYDNLKSIHVSMREAKGRIEKGEDYDAVLADMPIVKAGGAAKVIEKNVSDLTKMRRKVQASDNPDKRELAKQINEQIEQQMRQLNQVVDSALKASARE